jgi:NAD(P)-dependent dehydrogenase (short-subunit alcohol dehydrogenase family)
MACVLISGCSSGFGLETAIAFARLGDPVVAGLRNPSKAEDLKRIILNENLPIHLQQLDVTSSSSIDRATAEAISLHGEIKVLVNNAGIGAIGSLEETPEDVSRQLFETNIFGALNLIKSVLPYMRKARRGVIINIGSIQGVVPVPFFPIYGATKAALSSLTDSLHYEIEPFGLRAIVIEPGRFRTSFSRNLVSDRNKASVYKGLMQAWLEGWSKIPGRENLPPSALVASAIVKAAEDETSPRHLPVGPDVEHLSERRSSLTDSQFEAYLREITGYPSR